MYKNKLDERLCWLEEVFIPDLLEWRSNNLVKFGASDLEKSSLSKQTYEGLYLATKGMVGLVRTLLLGFSCVSTRRISQDSLEAYFGHRRALGRRNENPNIFKFGYWNNSITLKRQLYHKSMQEQLKKRFIA